MKKNSFFYFGIIFLGLTPYYTNPMNQWLWGNALESENKHIVEQLPLKELEKTYALARQAQQQLRSTIHKLLAGADLTEDYNQTFDMFTPQRNNEEATKKLKDFLHTYSGDDILSYLSWFVLQGADINMPIIISGPEDEKREHRLGLGLLAPRTITVSSGLNVGEQLPIVPFSSATESHEIKVPGLPHDMLSVIVGFLIYETVTKEFKKF